MGLLDFMAGVISKRHERAALKEKYRKDEEDFRKRREEQAAVEAACGKHNFGIPHSYTASWGYVVQISCEKCGYTIIEDYPFETLR